MIQVSSLSCSYNGDTVLEDVSFDVKKRDFVAMIGPNGSGKTTLIKAILGKLKPDKGIIKLFGKKLEEFTEWERIGYVPQRFSFDKLFPGTVEEILNMGRRGKIIPALGIRELLRRKFSELSGGQQQQVLIAFALQSNPELLILDEPTVGIDAKSQQEFYRMLKHLNAARGVTIIVVTHDVGIIPSHFKRVICIHQKMCCQGPVSEIEDLLKKAYGSQFVPHTHPC